MAESITVDHNVIIVGGGICGLATALALHRKGIKSVVLEKSDTLRATGAAIIIQPNGWRALEQLGVASKLVHDYVSYSILKDINLDTGESKEAEMGVGSTRCLFREDLLKALAVDLPEHTIHFGCKTQSIDIDPVTSYPNVLQNNGCILKAKVLIGCDGVNSVVADFLGMKSRRFFSQCAIRGVTKCTSFNKFENKFVMLRKGNVQLGRMPMDANHIYWFVTRTRTSQDPLISNDPKLILDCTMKCLSGFPKEELELVMNSCPEHLFLTQLCYRAPWALLRTGLLKKGTIVLAGDAMHAMGPFIAQGGSASMEDAVVFARCFAKRTRDVNPISQDWRKSVHTAIDEFLKERKKRVMKLSTEAFLIGTLVGSSSALIRFVCIALMVILFSDSRSHHSLYDCGQL